MLLQDQVVLEETMEWEMIPLNQVVTQAPQIVPTDERSLKIWILLPVIWMRIEDNQR